MKSGNVSRRIGSRAGWASQEAEKGNEENGGAAVRRPDASRFVSNSTVPAKSAFDFFFLIFSFFVGFCTDLAILAALAAQQPEHFFLNLFFVSRTSELAGRRVRASAAPTVRHDGAGNP